jgi:hypothetical protein
LAKRDASRQDRKPTASMKGLALTFLLLTWIMARLLLTWIMARKVSRGRDPDRLAPPPLAMAWCEPQACRETPRVSHFP